MARITDPPTEDVPRLTWRRLVLLSFALLIGPGRHHLGRGPHKPVDIPVMIAGSTVLAVLVLARLTGLVGRRNGSPTSEQILREGSASLATSTGRHMMNRNTLQAVTRLADGADDLRVSMALVVDRGLQVVDAVGHLAEDAIGTAARSTRCLMTWPRRSFQRSGSYRPTAVPSISGRASTSEPRSAARRSARVPERAERRDHRHHRATRRPVGPSKHRVARRRPSRWPWRARPSPRTCCVARANAGSGRWSRTPRTSCWWSPTISASRS